VCRKLPARIPHACPTSQSWAKGALPFNAGKLCFYAGGMIPFARTKAERDAAGEPRPWLEDCYGDHAGYIAAVPRRWRK
jgi:hypothetical protein